ncbi:hypothetical protein [Candidatus Electrothrix sp.]|uniref:hypothetical protein n=1 Tax=Candidatus Electrothrix sp. TaxID=2170559 RepID=UPI0040559F09
MKKAEPCGPAPVTVILDQTYSPPDPPQLIEYCIGLGKQGIVPLQSGSGSRKFVELYGT